MITQSLEYFAPASVRQAALLLRKYRDKAKLLAGGQSLIPLMNLGIVSPKYIIDITKVSGLSYVKETANSVVIGALTTHEVVKTSRIIKNNYPILVDATSHIGDPQIRHRGTIGGAVCHADPAGDYLPPLVVLDAEFSAQTARSKRMIRAKDFFQDAFTTSLKPSDVLTEIRLPKTPPRTGTAYLKLELITGGFAIVGVAALVTLDKTGACRNIRVVIGGAEPAPIRLWSIEEDIPGKQVDAKTVATISQVAFDEVKKPLSDVHADGEYRKDMARVFTKRALDLALLRASHG